MKLALAVLLALFAVSGPANAKLAVGAVPPDFLGKTPDSQEIRISEYKGTVVVVTFWASWCGPCRAELPRLNILQNIAGDRIHIVAVNVDDTPEAYKMIRRQLKGTKLTFTRDASGKIKEGFDVHSYPNLYVIDQTGVVSAVHVGFGDDSMLEIIKDINTLLRAAAPKAPDAPASAVGAAKT